MKYTKKDIGCWIDGAYGEKHSRIKLATMMEELGNMELARELLKEPSEDWEEMNDATYTLEENTEEGLMWIWEAGDLILTDEGD